MKRYTGTVRGRRAVATVRKMGVCVSKAGRVRVTAKQYEACLAACDKCGVFGEDWVFTLD